MTRHAMLALLLTLLVLTSRAASADQQDEPTPGHFAVAPAALSFGAPGAAASGGDGPRRQAATPNDSFCLTCHSDATLETRASGGPALSLHVDARALRDSAHGLLGCLTCHADLKTHPDQPIASPGLAGDPARAVEMCVRCHLASAGDYADSVHGAPVLSGTGDGATCNDCHSPDGSGHSTSRTADFQTADSVTESCGRCHGDALATYRRTAHGQLVEFAGTERAATCTDCHGAHAVSAVDGASGALAPARLAAACGECHRDADEQFADEWRGHEASVSPSGVADYLHRGVVLLMAVGVCFGVTHVTLDFLRNPRHLGGRPK